ncbi:hypothetical protein ACOIWV_004484 [Vibrio parahaemolyticus]
MSRKCFLCFILILWNGFSYAEVISYPNCERSESLKTPIHLYLSEKVLKARSKNDVHQILNKWINFSNVALRNSCVPIERYLSKVEFLEGIDETWFQSLSAAKVLLTLNLGYEPPELNDKSLPSFVGVVFDSYQASFGRANCGLSSDSGNFFFVALDCAEFVMEHEIGHLSGAHHDHESILSSHSSLDAFELTTYPRVEPFAYGWRCGNYGTVMSFAPQKIPAYSSPELFVGDLACGDLRSGDNARVMREYALEHLHKN